MADFKGADQALDMVDTAATGPAGGFVDKEDTEHSFSDGSSTSNGGKVGPGSFRLPVMPRPKL
jgi:hypothetical protein